MTLSLAEQLMEACKEGTSAAVKDLLEQGAPASARDSGVDDKTALMIASSRGDLEIVRLLLEKGAPVNETSMADNALIFAGRNGEIETAELLIQHGATYPHDTPYGKATLNLIQCVLKESKIVSVLKSAPTEQQLKDRKAAIIRNVSTLKRDLPCPSLKLKLK